MIDLIRRYLSNPWQAHSTAAFVALAISVIALDVSGHVEAGWVVSIAGPFVVALGFLIVFVVRRIRQR